jgi:hypothetical protein
MSYDKISDKNKNDRSIMVALVVGSIVVSSNSSFCCGGVGGICNSGVSCNSGNNVEGRSSCNDSATSNRVVMVVAVVVSYYQPQFSLPETLWSE